MTRLLIELLQHEMLKTSLDVKAEAQLAIALDTGLSYEDFMVRCDSVFYREYSKDIFTTELTEDPRKKKILEIHLSRSGLYDQLPEGLFFQPGVAGRQATNAAEMAAEYKINKQKETDTRNFFQPLENDLFRQRVEIEAEETSLLKGLQSGMLLEYFIHFWGLPDFFPKSFIIPFISLLPHARKIAGNLPLTAKCLELLLQEKVQVRKVAPSLTETGSIFIQELGKQQLGVDLICGDNFVENCPVLEFTVGPLENSHVSEYLEGGNRFVLLETFYQFFVPVYADIITLIEVLPGKKNMHLLSNSDPVLGYSSVL